MIHHTSKVLFFIFTTSLKYYLFIIYNSFLFYLSLFLYVFLFSKQKQQTYPLMATTRHHPFNVTTLNTQQPTTSTHQHAIINNYHQNHKLTWIYQNLKQQTHLPPTNPPQTYLKKSQPPWSKLEQSPSQMTITSSDPMPNPLPRKNNKKD